MGNTDPGLGTPALGAARQAPAGPIVAAVPCPACGAPVDPLRADRVAIFRFRFHYFCSTACRERFVPPPGPPPLPSRRRPDESLTIRGVQAPANLGARKNSAMALESVENDGIADLVHHVTTAAPPAPAAEPVAPDVERAVPPPADVGLLLLGLAGVGGLLAVGLVLAGRSPVALTARVVLAAVGCGALVAQAALSPRDPTEPHPFAMLAAPVLAVCTALAAWLGGDPLSTRAATLAGLVVAALAGITWMVQRARREVEDEIAGIRAALDAPGRRVVGGEVMDARADELRPGEELVLEKGDVVPVDAVITAGKGRVLPWLGAKHAVERAEGDALVAGGRIVEGRLRGIVGWAGNDRAWMRLTNDVRRRADIHAPTAKLGRLVAERGAIVASGLAALTAYASNRDTVGILLFAVAAHAAIASPAVAQVGALHVARGIVAALRRGIAFRTAEAFERAARVSTAAFCARGTVLVGEPEVANVDAYGPHEPERVLALVAAVESGETHPAARAIVRAARERGVRSESVRNPRAEQGLGVTAVSSTGEPVVVGSRALMLRERISIAAAESAITDLEAMGRNVILVAMGGRLVGILGLQDGLRPGARAAVQHLLDVGVEPVLLSGDARETCEALGRALDIDHIRPEVLPTERGAEVQRLSGGGATVAVLGRSPVDDAALAAADVAVALDSAGSGSGEWSVQLATDNVREAACSIKLAHLCRSEARLGLTLALATGVSGVMAIAFSLAPPALAPGAAVAGALMALIRFRARR